MSAKGFLLTPAIVAQEGLRARPALALLRLPFSLEDTAQTLPRTTRHHYQPHHVRLAETKHALCGAVHNLHIVW